MNLKGTRGVVFGKGPSFQQRPKVGEEIHVCINHAVNVQPCDVYVFNDYEMAWWTEAHATDTLQLVVLPTWPHLGGEVRPGYDWRRCLDELGWEGEYFLHRLRTAPEADGVPTFAHHWTAAETAVEWLLLNGCREIECHGIGRGTGYHPLFEAVYHEPRWEADTDINQIGVNLHALAESYGARLTLH